MGHRSCNTREGAWFKASYSSGCGACVEVRYDADIVSIRDSKYRLNPNNDPIHEPVIALTFAAWQAFLQEVTEVKSVGINNNAWTESAKDGSVTIHSSSGVSLSFTSLEWITFFLGIRGGQFDRPLPIAS